MISEEFKKRIEKYDDLEWNSLTRSGAFAEAGNFSAQKELFDKTKEIFDLLLKNISTLSKRLPAAHLQILDAQLTSFLTLVDRIDLYTDISNHTVMVEDIKSVTFEVQDTISKYVEHLDIDPKERTRVIKKEFEKLDNLQKEVRDAVNVEMNKLKKGVEKTSQGKVQVAGGTFSQFFREQAVEHRENAEGAKHSEGQVIKGWLQVRSNFNISILATIILTILLFTGSYITVLSGNLDKEIWRMFWDIRVGVLLVALLTALYTGMYFATKNYNKEKDLEYENMNKANVAETMLLLSASSSDNTESIIISEASKTLFATTSTGNGKGGDSGDKSINISLPAQRVPQLFAKDTDI